MASVVPLLELTASASDGSAWLGRSGIVLSLADGPAPLALAGVVLAVIGAVVVRRRSDNSAEREAGTDNQREPTPVTFEERIGKPTLERLEPITPDAVARVRDLEFGRSTDHDAVGEQLERAERELRRGLEDALADDRLNIGLTAPNGTPYEIVNLPSRYRELSLPPSGRTVHVDAAEQAVRDRLEDGSIREAAMAAVAVDEHRQTVHEYVRRHEQELVESRDEIEATLADVCELVDRLDGELADRVNDFVLAGRHDAIAGVTEIERDLADAIHLVSRCSFEDARRELRTAREAADDLLVTVDFLGGLVGTIEHGSGRVELPGAVSTALVSDLVSIIERQYDVDATIDGSTIIITDRSVPQGDSKDTSGMTQTRETKNRDTTDVAAAMGTHSGVTTESVADEILFVLRELDGEASTVQCQTERLPDGVAQPAVLEELAAFCRRQTDVVATVDLQEGAPPGFLEIEFTDRTTSQSGLETLRERFIDRHGK